MTIWFDGERPIMTMSRPNSTHYKTNSFAIQNQASHVTFTSRVTRKEERRELQPAAH